MNVGIVEDTAGTYKGVHVTAHEAAHLLGVVHDGMGPAANIPGHPGAQRLGCGWEDGYMMSYVDKGPRFSRFSPCAQDQIRVTLSFKTAVCIEEHFSVDYLTQLPGRLPGSAFDEKDYCRLMHPGIVGIFYLSPQKSEILVTCKIQCQTPLQLNQLFYTYTHPAPDGLPRSDKATCLQGVCTRTPPSS
ncbi:uncharacterized protein LOC121835136 [Ixodes scapularis]|uniref:uncharacterized protein LOC121835136 n=1 Tax=Ixodes scapularis TaxID=6945 RepID=UPI001C38DA4E|nr:uncharacterized protein LOC121835136 [Ixodes scapularis]